MWQDTVSGCVGAACCTVFGLPFDVAKSRQQANPGVYGSLGGTFRQIVRGEGVGALYKGMTPALSSALAENSVGITVNRTLRRQLGLALGTPDARFSPGVEVALGGATGLFTSLAICPFEVLKVRQQLRTSSQPVSWLGELRQLLAADGVVGCFRGLGPLIARDVPFNALFYGSYESICTFFMRIQSLESKESLGPVTIFAAGGLAGSAGWSLIIPMDVVKTRVQAGTSAESMVSMATAIVAAEGWGALFVGWTAAVVRAFPANAGLFLGVELSSRALARLFGKPSSREAEG